MPTPPTVTVIIPVRDDAVRLRGCLESIADNLYAGPTPEVIVADNGSKDPSPQVALAAGAKVLALPGLPVAEMRNRAAAEASGDVLVFVDADHILAADWISIAVDCLHDPTVAGAGSPYFAPAGGTWVQDAYERLRVRPVGRPDVEWLGSGSLAIKSAVFREMGGFDARLETCEDVDLCNRMRQRGWRVVADEGLYSTHLGDPSTLRALYFGELWRGRDNLKVTLRGPITARALPSLLIPLVNLAALVAIPVGLASWPWGGKIAVVAALLVLMGATALRVTRMAFNAGGGLSEILQDVPVAFVYELARALALVTKATHKTRRERAEKASPAVSPSDG